MATTTNYGWTTPDDTALVKDGAAAIRTLGSSVDTSVKALSPGTTAGDLDYYTTSTAKARIGIGTTGQVLTVLGGVPAWTTVSSGGMTLLSTTTLSGASTTISSISGSYTNLFIYAYGVNLSISAEFWVAPNAVTNLGFTSGIEQSTAWAYTGARVPLSRGNTGSAGERVTNGRTDNAFSMLLQNYASAASHKTTNINSAYYVTNQGNITPNNAGGSFASTTAVTSLVFSPSTGVFNAGTVLLYGVK
jgi:hypothetical protein